MASKRIRGRRRNGLWTIRLGDDDLVGVGIHEELTNAVDMALAGYEFGDSLRRAIHEAQHMKSDSVKLMALENNIPVDDLEITSESMDDLAPVVWDVIR